MRNLAILVAATVGIAAPAATQAVTAPKLRLVGLQPLAVRGESFRPGERIVVTALTLSGAKRVVVRSTSRGRFGTTFHLPSQPCGKAFAVRAVGALGSRATLRVTASPCVPPPID